MVNPLNRIAWLFGRLHLSARLKLALFGLVFVLFLSSPVVAQTPTIIPICQIQGKGFASDWEDQFVYVQGIVTADFDLRRGLIALQQPHCDSDPKTSDGVWVALSPRADVVRRGDRVQVAGTVQESFRRTQIASNPAQIEILSTDHPLPEAAELLPPQENSEANRYFEAREGMLVSVASANVIGPTDSYETTWLMPAALDVPRLFYNDLRGTGGVLGVDEGGDYALNPALKVGDQVQNVVGVLDEAYEAHRIYLLEEPTIIESPFWGAPQTPPLNRSGAFRLATFNLANLFDDEDDPNVNDSILSKTEYQRRLRKRTLVLQEVLGDADLVALQEVENERVLRDLLAQPDLNLAYAFIWEDSPDLRGLDVALLYRSDRFRVTDVRQEQGCTDLIDGLGPDGNQNVRYPQNAVTCDRDGDSRLDGNRLFLRPPLVVKLEFLAHPGGFERPPLIVIVNHWKSKVEDTPSVLYTLPRRIQEAEFTAALIDRLRQEFPQVPLLLGGDFNDFPTSLPLQKLLATGVIDLTQAVAPEQRYSYIYRGVSQNIDFIFLDSAKGLQFAQITPLHFNADYPYEWTSRADTPIRASDHDLWLAELVFPLRLYLPLIARTAH